MTLFRLSQTAGADLRKVVALAVPSIITNITTPLLGLVDLAITGHISDGPGGEGGALYIAAIAVGSSVFTMLYWLFAFLRMGTGGITAQALGSGDNHSVDLALWRSLIVALIAGGIITLCGGLIGSAFLHFMDPDPATIPIARRYISILAWGAPASLATFSLTGWFIGRQDTRSPMWVSLAINLINIGLSLILVIVLGLKIEGVATGTLVAQWSGFILSLILCLCKYHPQAPRISQLLQATPLRRFFSVNSDIFLRTLCMVAVTTWFTRAGAQQGDVVLAVNALLMQLFLSFSYFMDGFAFAGESLSGLYYGAGNRDALRRITIIILWCGGVLALIFTLLYFFGGEWFLSVMSNDRRLALASADYFMWAVSVPLIGFTAFSLDAIAIGLTATRRMLISALSGALIFFAVYIISYPTMGNHGLWLAFVSYLAVRGLSLAMLLKRFIHR